MKLKTEIIERVRGRKEIVPLISAEMGVSKNTVKAWLKRNADDGWLTTFKVLAILRDKLGLTDDQILETGEPLTASKALKLFAEKTTIDEINDSWLLQQAFELLQQAESKNEALVIANEQMNSIISGRIGHAIPGI